ncbi:CLL_collapsed_G0029240.mRNA.1.CDS.1 [Saccharomyces cerevisiae]|nr:CLL_collapsed_G0029240.mRNA.1.CDS.1 [Saccharomyces cerevisiae]
MFSLQFIPTTPNNLKQLKTKTLMLEFPISVLLGCLVAVKAQTTFPNFESDVLNEHNKFRALHVDTAPLTWSDTLATYAQNYAGQPDWS